MFRFQMVFSLVHLLSIYKIGALTSDCIGSASFTWLLFVQALLKLLQDNPRLTEVDVEGQPYLLFSLKERIAQQAAANRLL